MWDDWNAIQAEQNRIEAEAQQQPEEPAEPIPIENARSVRQRASQPVLEAPEPAYVPPPPPKREVVDDATGFRLLARWLRPRAPNIEKRDALRAELARRASKGEDR